MRKTLWSVIAAWAMILTLLTAFPSTIHAQSTSEYLQEFSPNAAELGKYGKVPVSYFNGLPDIRVPLYDLKARNYTLPIYLSYYAGGHRTEQHPGWVGIGWTLHAGGCINRIVNGLKDELTFDEIQVNDPQAMQFPYDPGYFDHMDEMTATNWMNDAVLDGMYSPFVMPDYMPDEFQINIEDIHASFYFVGQNQVKIVSKSPVDFTVECQLNDDELDQSGDYPGSLVMYRSATDTNITFNAHLYRYIEKLIVTNKDGTKYHFGGNKQAIEFSINQRYNYQAAQINPSQYHRWNAVGTANTWMLTKIERPDGEEVTFTYEHNGIPIVRRQAHRIMEYDEVIGTDQNQMAHIMFWNTFSGVMNNHNVPYLGISYTFVMPSYLKRISCKQSQDFVSITTTDSSELEYGFNETEFTTLVGRFEGSATPFPPLYMKGESRYRQLTAINTPRGNCSFYYENLPSERLRLSEVRRYMGPGIRVASYKMAYNSLRLPAYGARQSDAWGFYNGVSMPMTASDTTGINSRCLYTNSSLAQAEMLTTLYYPTGGSTSFEYELHQVGKTVSQYPFSIVSGYLTVGGLRIKKVIDDPSYGSSRERTFSYSSATSMSSGILSGRPKCHIDGSLTRIPGTRENNQVTDYYHLYEDVSITPLSMTDGNHVTYSQIKETFGDGSYCVYLYSNHDTPGCLDTLSFNTTGTIHGRMFGDTFTSRELSRGLLLSKREYKSDGTLVRKTENEYNVDESDFIPSVSRIQMSATFEMYYRMSYDRIFSYYPYLKKQTVTTWPDSGSGTSVETVEYTYDSHRDVTVEKHTNGPDEYFKRTSYSGTLNGPTCVLMQARGMMNYPVETMEVRNGRMVSSRLVKYRQEYGRFVISSIHTAAIGCNLPYPQFNFSNGDSMDSRYVMERSYTSYDPYCNPLSFTDKDGTVSAIEWGYNGVYPVRLTRNPSDVYPERYTCTYHPVFGLESVTDRRGVTTSYQYDYMGRLTGIKDNDDNYITRYEYRYKTDNDQSTGSNYVKTKVSLSASQDSSAVTINYMNSLGELLQKVLVGGSPSGGCLYDWTGYDAVGRQSTQWLPSRVQNDGSYVVPIYDLRLYASDCYTDSRPFTAFSYQATPEGRPASKQGPGMAWNTAGKKDVYSYQIGHPSIAQTRVTKYSVSYSGNQITIARTGFGIVGEHTIVVTTDEDGHTVREFKDMMGETVQVIKENQTGQNTEYLTTVYVRDNAGRVVAILPPLLSSSLTSGDTWSSSNVDAIEDYGYYYRYDVKGRLIAKKLPGADWIYYVYDKGDRQVMSQDGNQRLRGEWSFRIVDKQGRSCLTGICNNSIDPFGSPFDTVNVMAERSWEPSALFGYEISGLSLVTPVVLTADWWDHYSLPMALGQPSYYDENFQTETGSDERYYNSSGLRTGGVVKTLGEEDENHYLWDVCWYDDKSRPVQTVRKTAIGDLVREGFAYDFSGNLIRRYVKHTLFGGGNVTESYSYSFDSWGRPLVTTLRLNGGSPVTLHDYSYDNVGRLIGDARGNSSGTLSSVMSLNVRSWITDGETVTSSLDTLYREHLTYAPRWNGGISALTWKAGGDQSEHMYSYTYDGLGRLTSAAYSNIGGIAAPENNRSYEYDLHGNITRSVSSSYQVSTGTLSGNRLTMTDTPSGRMHYRYDANGNLTKLQRHGQLLLNAPTIEYNCLNLPSRYFIRGVADLHYVYSAAGEKLSRTVSGTGTQRFDYSSNLVYADSTLHSVLIDGGFIDMHGATPQVHFYVKDHQGNVRVEATPSGTIVNKYHYAPYGETIDEDTSTDNPYRWSSKEWDETLLSYDFGARYYRPSKIPFWTTMDPLCEKYPDISPYAYCAGDPVNLVDPEGKIFKRTWRGNTIVVSANIYVPRESNKSAQSAKQAARHWNNRNDDIYQKDGKSYSVKYKLSIVPTDAIEKMGDTYEVLPSGTVKNPKTGEKVSGQTIKNMDPNQSREAPIQIDEAWAVCQPGTKEQSSTGAHEIGHFLGIDGHTDGTLMSEAQDSQRTLSLNQEQINAIIESPYGVDDIWTRVLSYLMSFFR